MEKKNNSGVLFTNTKKQKETHPDLTGNIVINGKELNIVAWRKQGKNGAYLSLAINEKQEFKKNDDFIF